MLVTKFVPPPVVQPVAKVVIELTESEALTLKQLLGGISGSGRRLSASDCEFTDPTPRQTCLDALFHALDREMVTIARASPNAEERALFLRGDKIPAIKLYRDRTGAGLKEAKDIIETIR